MSSSPSSPSLDGKRVLIIKQSSLGDVVHTLPVAHALKRVFPQVSITWLVQQVYADFLRADPSIEKVVPVHIPSTSDPDAGWTSYLQAGIAMIQTFQRLRTIARQAPFDYVLDLHASFRSGFFSLATPGGVRVGFADAREFNSLFQHKRLPNPEGRTHALEKNLLFNEFFASPAQEEDFFVATDTVADQEAEDFLTQHHIDPARPLVYMNPMARWQSKLWFRQSWAALADQLRKANIQVIFGGGPGDIPYLQDICEKMATFCLISAGKLSLSASTALIKKAQAYVGVDTGPTHIAAMAGIPVVVLFGSTHPERVRPYESPGKERGASAAFATKHTLLQASDIDCLCCRKRTCASRDCMEKISVEQVFQAVMHYVSV